MTATLTPWAAGFRMPEPFRTDMRGLMECFFGDAFRDEPPAAMPAWTPRVDVEETDKELLVKADLPGVDPKEVEVSIENGILTVRGEKKEEKEVTEKNVHRLERFSGAFYRAVALPAGAEAEKVTASSVNGVITIVIPKKPEVRPRRIPVAPKT